jgi:PilZ domain
VPRTILAATAEILELHSTSGKSLSAQTLDLSVSGCYLEMPDPLPVRAAISLKLTYGESVIAVFADVVRSEPGKGMGIKFRALEPPQVAILKGWFFAVDRPDW